MADEEAEQERLSRGGGGCIAELQRLGERLQELERQLRESRMPAVEAATDYCQQLCQVRAPGGPLPLSPILEGGARERAPGGRAVVVAALALSPLPPGREQRVRGRRLCVAAAAAAPAWGEGVVVRAESPPPLSFPELGLRGPEGGDAAGESWRPLRRGARVRGDAGRVPFLLGLCAGDYRAPRIRAWFPLGRASAPSGLIPLPPLRFHPSRPRPGPRCLPAFVVRVSP